MSITIHPDARQHFDDLGEKLLAQLSTAPPPPPGKSAWADKLHASGTLDLADVYDGSWFENPDLIAGKGFLVVKHVGGWLGLWAAGYVALTELTRNIQRTRPLRDTVTVKFVREEIFNWLRARHANHTEQRLTEALLASLEIAVTEHEVWVPVSYLHIESPFSIGNVRFQTWEPAMFDAWVKAIPEDKLPEERQAILAWIEKQRGLLQGHAAGIVKVYAEEDRAVEKALDTVEVALGILRLYSTANYRADLTTYCALERDVHMHGAAGYVFDTGPIPDQHEMVVSKREHWVIRTQDLNDFRAMGMDPLGMVAAKEQRTAFEDQALSALLLYTRGALKEDLSDRVVYQLAGLESLLITGEQEQLVQNLRERLAFSVATTGEAREEVIDAVNQVYKLRSGFVHHGRPVEDAKVFNRFAPHGWRFFTQLADNLHFQSKEHLVKAIDRIKFYGNSAAHSQPEKLEDFIRVGRSMAPQRHALVYELKFTEKQLEFTPEMTGKVPGAGAIMHVTVESDKRIEKPSVTIHYDAPMIKTVMAGRAQMGSWLEGQKGDRYTISWSQPLEAGQKLEATVYSAAPIHVVKVTVQSLAD